MIKLDVFNSIGEKKGSIELAPGIFNAEVSPAAVHQVVVSMQANLRNPVAHTKTRGQIRGGGRKPWKQKGTGNARAGSIRSPLWRGGGVVFGPTNQRNYSKKVSKGLFRKSLISVLSDRINSNSVYILEDLQLADGKTKELNKKLSDFKNKLGIKTDKLVVIVSKISANLARSSKNLQNLEIVSVDSLSTLNFLSAPIAVILKDAVPLLEKRLVK